MACWSWACISWTPGAPCHSVSTIEGSSWDTAVTCQAMAPCTWGHRAGKAAQVITMACSQGGTSHSESRWTQPSQHFRRINLFFWAESTVPLKGRRVREREMAQGGALTPGWVRKHTLVSPIPPSVMASCGRLCQSKTGYSTKQQPLGKPSQKTTLNHHVALSLTLLLQDWSATLYFSSRNSSKRSD